MGGLAMVGIIFIACMYGLWHTTGAIYYWINIHNSFFSSSWDWVNIGFFSFCTLILLGLPGWIIVKLYRLGGKG